MSVNKKMKALQEVMIELLKIKEQYGTRYSELRESAKKEVIEFQYSKGGETMPRGYYCPSPILEYVVGNCKRGRLLKKAPKDENFTYEYGFDCNKRLISVKRATELFDKNKRLFYEEYLIYKDNVIYSLEFSISGVVISVTRCIYNGEKIIRYERSTCSIENQADLIIEEYIYEHNILTEVTMFYNIMWSKGAFIEDKFRLEYDNKGKIIRLAET